MWSRTPSMSNSCRAGLMVRQLVGSGLVSQLGSRSSGRLGRETLAWLIRHAPSCCACLTVVHWLLVGRTSQTYLPTMLERLLVLQPLCQSNQAASAPLHAVAAQRQARHVHGVA